MRASPPLHVDRRADARALDEAAQRMADALEAFVQAYPMQWFDFGP